MKDSRVRLPRADSNGCLMSTWRLNNKTTLKLSHTFTSFQKESLRSSRGEGQWCGKSFVLPLRVYKKMFPNNHTTDGLPKPNDTI